jgi:hypothetical protein
MGTGNWLPTFWNDGAERPKLDDGHVVAPAAWPDWIRVEGNLVLILCASCFSYLSFVVAPYRLLDDNWLLRGSDPDGSYPGLDFIAYVQGRPAFAAMIWASRRLAHAFPIDAIAILRLGGVVLLGLFGVVLFRLLCRVGWHSRLAFLASVGAISLPTFQIYIGGGPWLTVPLVLSAIACLLLAGERSFSAAAVAIILLVTSFAIYQSTPFIAVPLTVASIMIRPVMDRRAISTALWIMINLLIAMAIYYVLWRVVFATMTGGADEQRYSPTGVVGLSRIRMSQFLTMRLPQNLRLWDIRNGSDLYENVTMSVILLGLLAHWLRLRSKIGTGPSTRESLIRCGLFTVCLLAADLAALASPQPIMSYTTTTGLSLCIYFAIVWSLFEISSLFHRRADVPLAILAISGLLIGQATALTTLVLPLRVETIQFRAAVIAYIDEYGHQPDHVVVHIQPSRYTAAFAQEFSWRNLQHEFWAHWFVKNQFSDLSLDPDVEIALLEGVASPTTVHGATRPLSDTAPLVFDGRQPISIAPR